MRFIILLLILGQLSANAGDLEEFRKKPGDQIQKWTGFKRKVPRDKPRLLRESAERRREAYISHYQELAKKMAAEREAALNLALDASLIRVSLKTAEESCKVVSTLEDSERCLSYIRVILDKITKLNIHLAALSHGGDREVGQVAGKVANDLGQFEGAVRATFDNWLENKFTIRRELDRQNAEAAAKSGRERAKCVSAPLILQNEIWVLEKELSRAKVEVEPFAIASGLERCAGIKSFITVTEKTCGTDLSAFQRRADTLKTNFDAYIESGEFIEWYKKRCRIIDVRYPDEFNCSSTPNAASLFAMQQLFKAMGEK